MYWGQVLWVCSTSAVDIWVKHRWWNWKNGGMRHSYIFLLTVILAYKSRISPYFDTKSVGVGLWEGEAKMYVWLWSVKSWMVTIKGLWCRDVRVVPWIGTERVSVRVVKCSARVTQCNLTARDITGHLLCAGFVEWGPFTGNEAMVQSNQRRFISCQLQLCITCVDCGNDSNLQFTFSAYTSITNFDWIFATDHCSGHMWVYTIHLLQLCVWKFSSHVLTSCILTLTWLVVQCG